MVSLIIVTLLVPIAPLQWSFWLSATYPLGLTSPVTQWAMPLLMVAGITGILLGSLMPLRRNLSRSSRLPVRFLQDLFAYDVYLDKIYGATVVAAVAAIAKISTWFDRYVIDGIVNLVSLVTIFSGSALKYNVTGQSQFYLLTILVGVALLIWFSLSGQWMAIRQFWSSWLSLILP